MSFNKLKKILIVLVENINPPPQIFMEILETKM